MSAPSVIHPTSATFGDLFPPYLGVRHDSRPCDAAYDAEASYTYRDAEGNEVAWKHIFRCRCGQRHKSALWEGDGRSAPLFVLPAVVTAQQVIVVEGERDVVTLARALGIYDQDGPWGTVPTSFPHGTALSQWDREDLVWPLRGKRLVLVPDRDEPGEAFMRRGLEHFPDATLFTIPPPDKDVSDMGARLQPWLVTLIGGTQ